MKISVLRSAVIDAPVERVWAVLRDFGGWERWHPSVVESRMENDAGGDVVGGVRRIRYDDGAEMREQLLHHSDRDRSVTSSIIDSPLPLFTSLVTVRLRPVTDGNRTYWHWRWIFHSPKDRAAALEKRVGQDLCKAGIAGLRRFLAEKEAPARTAAPREEPVGVAFPKERLLPSMAVVVEAYGGPEVLSSKEGMVPAPGPCQVRLRQEAIAVNEIDIRHRAGAAGGFDVPGTPGVEGTGEILDAGEHADGLFPGDRVVYLSRTPGAYAEIRCVDADACILVPDGISYLNAAVLLKGATAALLLDRVFRAPPGAALLIQAASGGIGHLLSQWARTRGLTVIGTASTDAEARFSRDHGCDHPVVGADDADLTSEVMRITNGRGVDYWVHSDDRHSLETAMACLARCGHLAVIGQLGEPSISLNLKELKRRSLTVSAPAALDYLADRSYLQRLAQQLFAKIQNGSIAPAVETLPLSGAAGAHRRIEQGETMGCLALTPRNSSRAV